MTDTHGSTIRVQLVDQTYRHTPSHLRSGGSSGRSPGSRVNRWIVRTIMISTTAFALIDLLLLVTGGHR